MLFFDLVQRLVVKQSSCTLHPCTVQLFLYTAAKFLNAQAIKFIFNTAVYCYIVWVSAELWQFYRNTVWLCSAEEFRSCLHALENVGTELDVARRDWQVEYFYHMWKIPLQSECEEQHIRHLQIRGIWDRNVVSMVQCFVFKDHWEIMWCSKSNAAYFIIL